MNVTVAEDQSIVECGHFKDGSVHIDACRDCLSKRQNPKEKV